jgi:hypothetical protein
MMRSRRIRLALPGSPKKSITYREKPRWARKLNVRLQARNIVSAMEELLVNPRDQRRHILCILFELGPKCLPQ